MDLKNRHEHSNTDVISVTALAQSDTIRVVFYMATALKLSVTVPPD